MLKREQKPWSFGSRALTVITMQSSGMFPCLDSCIDILVLNTSESSIKAQTDQQIGTEQEALTYGDTPIEETVSVQVPQITCFITKW